MKQFAPSIHNDTLTSFYNMISVNIFRVLPRIPKTYIEDVNDTIHDTSWPHLELIYICFKNSLKLQLTQVIMKPSFIYNLIGNIFSGDERERNLVKEVLYRIYHSHVCFRMLIRKQISYHLFSDEMFSRALRILWDCCFRI